MFTLHPWLYNSKHCFTISLFYCAEWTWRDASRSKDEDEKYWQVYTVQTHMLSFIILPFDIVYQRIRFLLTCMDCSVIKLYSWPKHVTCFFTALEVNNQWLVFLGRPPHLQDPILSTRANRASLIIKNFGRGSWRPNQRNCKGLWMKSPIDKFVLFQTRQVWFMVWYGLFVVACCFCLFVCLLD